MNENYTTYVSDESIAIEVSKFLVVMEMMKHCGCLFIGTPCIMNNRTERIIV